MTANPSANPSANPITRRIQVPFDDFTEHGGETALRDALADRLSVIGWDCIEIRSTARVAFALYSVTFCATVAPPDDDDDFDDLDADERLFGPDNPLDDLDCREGFLR
jgi:hypothetical protein